MAKKKQNIDKKRKIPLIVEDSEEEDFVEEIKEENEVDDERVSSNKLKKKGKTGGLTVRQNKSNKKEKKEEKNKKKKENEKNNKKKKKIENKTEKKKKNKKNIIKKENEQESEDDNYNKKDQILFADYNDNLNYRESIVKKLTIPALKDVLRHNNQLLSGTKGNLLERISQIQEMGNIPDCPKCAYGRLRYDVASGTYSCPGFYNIQAYHYHACTFYTDEPLARAPYSPLIDETL